MVRLGSSSGGGEGGGGKNVVVVRGRREGRRRRNTASVVPPPPPLHNPAADQQQQHQQEELVMQMMMPAWLRGVMRETFFVGCGAHGDRRKNEKNIFCLGCCLSICPHCLPSHRSHPLLQVRRYVYHDVVRLDDLQKLIDCSYIQPYTINGAKVIFLNERAQAMRASKGPANVCFTCDRILQNPFHFCSLSCKVDHMLRGGQDLSGILYRIHQSDFMYTQFEGEEEEEEEEEEAALEGLDDDGYDSQIVESSLVEVAVEMEPETEMEMDHQLDHPPLHFKPSIASHHRAGGAVVAASSRIQMATVCSGERKKKGSGSTFLPGMVLSLNSCRRKGAPQRSPLS
ncbi:hypothetical protein Dimus_015897 [Dionaea muscipula]